MQAYIDKKEVEKRVIEICENPIQPNARLQAISPVVSEIFDSEHDRTETQELYAVSPPV